MKAKITYMDGRIVEAEGAPEEVARLLAPPFTSFNPSTWTVEPKPQSTPFLFIHGKDCPTQLVNSTSYGPNSFFVPGCSCVTPL